MLEVAQQRFLHIDQQVVHPADGVELGRTLHQPLLAVGAAPGQHIQPAGVVEANELGPQQLRAQPLRLDDGRRADLEQGPHGLLHPAGPRPLGETAGAAGVFCQRRGPVERCAWTEDDDRSGSE